MIRRYEEFRKKSDKELISIIVSSQNSPDGIAAKEILEYRKHKVVKLQNYFIVFLTVILAISAIVEIILPATK